MREPQESQGNRSVPRALRFRSGPRPPPPSASPVVCVSSRYPRLRPSPRPAPLTRLGCGAPLRAPQCRLQLRLQLRSRSGSSGSRSDAAALGLGWGVPAAPPGPAVRAGAGRTGGAGQNRPAIRGQTAAGGLQGPALPCPAAATAAPPVRPLLPRAAARSTVTLSGLPRRRRGSLVSAWWRHGPGHCRDGDAEEVGAASRAPLRTASPTPTRRRAGGAAGRPRDVARPAHQEDL